MKKIKEYRVVCFYRQTEFEEEMKNLITQGYQPFGSLCGVDDCFSQAMVKYDEKDAIDLEAGQHLLADKNAEEAVIALVELGYSADEIKAAVSHLYAFADEVEQMIAEGGTQ